MLDISLIGALRVLATRSVGINPYRTLFRAFPADADAERRSAVPVRSWVRRQFTLRALFGEWEAFECAVMREEHHRDPCKFVWV